MGIVRKGKHSYLYRSSRRDGRVVTEYVCCGEMAVLLAQLRAAERAEKAEQRRQFLEWEQRRRETERVLVESAGRARAVADEALRAAGWHQVGRKWRKKLSVVEAERRLGRRSAGTTEERPIGGTMADTPTQLEPGDDPVHVVAGEWLLDTLALKHVTNLAMGLDASDEGKAYFRAELKGFMAQIAGDAPSPIELLLAQTAAYDWAALRTWQAEYFRMCRTGLDAIRSRHHQQRIDRCHRRLMATIRHLALVRRARIPNIRIDIARIEKLLAMAPQPQPAGALP